MRLDEYSGPCAERTRELAWDTTALGPISGWTPALELVLGLVFRSALPKLLIWGDDLITFYNDSFMQLLAPPGTAGIGSPVPSVLPRAWPEVRSFIHAALAGQTYGECDLVLQETAGDGACYYHVCFTPVQEGHGRPAGVLLDVYNTTRSRRQEKALRNENSWLTKLFAEAPVFMAYAHGPEFQIEFANLAFANFFDGRDLVGKPLRESIPEAFEQGFGEILDRVFRTGESFVGSKIEVAIKSPGDAQRKVLYADFVYQPVRSEHDAEVIGILCTGSDVTAHHNAQIEAERLKHQILHASRINAMGTMAMTVAHELNQPLAAATNYLAAAKLMLTRPSEGALPALQAAEEEVLRAGDVIRRIRSLVRFGHAERSSVSIERAYHRAVMLLAAGDVRGVTFALELAPDATFVMADEIQLEQIFTNLFKNAAAAMTSSLRKEVRLTTERIAERKVKLTVRDFGPGLPGDALQYLFEQVGTSSNEGLGLGLPLTRSLIEANGGTVEASNASDGGAIFTLVMDGAGLV